MNTLSTVIKIHCEAAETSNLWEAQLSVYTVNLSIRASPVGCPKLHIYLAMNGSPFRGLKVTELTNRRLLFISIITMRSSSLQSAIASCKVGIFSPAYSDLLRVKT